jgi:hypoxanthine phosphoribosyltransferase
VREIAWSALDEMVRGIAEKAGRFRPEVVIGVVKGGVFVGAAVAEALTCPFYAVRITRRSRDHGPLPRPKIFGKVPRQVKGKRVLIVDDVAASGETLDLARRLTRTAGASEVRTASISVRRKGFRPDWFAIATEELLVFPWDLEDPDSQRFRVVTE